MNETIAQTIDVKDLMKILNENRQEKQVVELTGLIEYVNSLEKQLGNVMTEIKTLKLLLEKTQLQTAAPELRVAKNYINKLQENVKKMLSQIGAIKEKIIDTAKSIVDDFKVRGEIAIDRLSEYSAIRQGLASFKENVNNNIHMVDKTIEKINQVSQEFNATVKHSKNVIRLVSNKERINEAASPSKSLVKPLYAVKSVLLKMDEGSQKAVNKVDQLSAHTRKALADFIMPEIKVKEHEKKPSVIEFIKQHKENSDLPNKDIKVPKLDVAR